MEPGRRRGRLTAVSRLSRSPARTRLARFALVALVLGALAACSSASPIATRAAIPSTLAGTAWTAVLVGSEATVSGSEPTATFTADQVRGSTGCNSYSGPYQYSAGTIAFGALATTLIGCAGAVSDVEQGFVKALDGATTVSMDPDGRLVVDGSGGSITFKVAGQPSAS
jgi:heat shock protein HslJ